MYYYKKLLTNTKTEGTDSRNQCDLGDKLTNTEVEKLSLINDNEENNQ